MWQRLELAMSKAKAGEAQVEAKAMENQQSHVRGRSAAWQSTIARWNYTRSDLNMLEPQRDVGPRLRVADEYRTIAALSQRTCE